MDKNEHARNYFILFRTMPKLDQFSDIFQGVIGHVVQIF